MKNKVIYTTDFGTRLWIGTDHGYCGSSLQGIHQGRIVSGKCRELRDSIELKHIKLHSDMVRLATTSMAYARGFGYSERLYPISEESYENLLSAERRMAAEQVAAAAAQRAAEAAARRAAVAAAVRSRIAARRAIPVPMPLVAMANGEKVRPAIPAGSEFRSWALHFARVMQASQSQMTLGDVRMV